MSSVVQYQHPAGAIVEYTPKATRLLNTVQQLLAMLKAGNGKQKQGGEDGNRA